MFPSWQNWKIASAGALLGLTGTLFATRVPVVTVRQVLNEPARSRATVQGWVEVREPNRFVLHDKTGAIRLETCPVWYLCLPLRPGERVRVEGEVAPRVRWHADQPVFIVSRLRREFGVEIPLRYDDGPPPWQRETWRVGLREASDE
jgi:uncharacterized protein YdeI (BOF family)